MNVTLGQAAKQAVIFLEQLYWDVYTLVQSMDKAMWERDWLPAEQSVISNDLGNRLTSKRWVLNSLYRLYLPASEEPPKRAIAVQIVFSPQDYDEAMVFVAAVRFAEGSTRTRKEIWGGWHSSSPALRFPADSTGPCELSDELRDGFFPGSERAEAFVIPLCGLTDAEALRQHLLEPALTLVSG